jgi:predicted nucleotidyltransferase
MTDFFDTLPFEIDPRVRSGAILLTVAGSAALGCEVEDASDRDYLGVFIEPRETLLGLSLNEPGLEALTYFEASTGEADVQKGLGDIEVKMHGLRKFAGLAAKGNPDVVAMLFAPAVMATPLGERLRAHADLFISQRAGFRYLGFLQSQLQRLTSGTGMKVKRPGLVEQYGFDLKYSYHVIRLGLQGIELMETGKLGLPLDAKLRALLLDVRHGHRTLDQVLCDAARLVDELTAAAESTHLPKQADVAAINELLLSLYVDGWR